MVSKTLYSALILPIALWRYVRTRRTPESGYQAFYWQSCISGGRVNDLLSRAIAKLRPPVAVLGTCGLLGEMDAAGARDCADRLRRDFTKRTPLMAATTERFCRLSWQVLKIDTLPNYYRWARCRWMKKMRFLHEQSGRVGRYTAEHNLRALDERVVFGMGGCMPLLLFPLAAALRGREEGRVLIVGAYTEDDLCWARAQGMNNVRGMDLFPYSPWIGVGDICQIVYADGEFEAVILGWAIIYGQRSERLVADWKRIIKPGGYLGLGIQSRPELSVGRKVKPPRVDARNSAAAIATLMQGLTLFIRGPALAVSTNFALVFRLPG